MISNSWSYVAPAYGITWTTLLLYSLSLWLRGRKGRK